MHVKYHNAEFFQYRNRKHLVDVSGYGGANGRIWEKNDRLITISEHKQYFNESYVE